MKNSRTLHIKILAIFLGVLSVGAASTVASGSTTNANPVQVQVSPEWRGGSAASSSMNRCRPNEAMVSRRHDRDEQGPVFFRCADVVTTINGTKVGFDQARKGKQISGEIKESAGTTFTCEQDKFMIAHFGFNDENGQTQYRCSPLVAQHQGKSYHLIYVSSGWSANIKESDSVFNCPNNQIMTGRKHTGDENGPTQYRCSTVSYREVR